MSNLKESGLKGLSPAEIKASLLLRGISQSEIAEVINVDRQSISNVINGLRTTLRIRKAIAKALDRDAKNIWPDEAFRRPSGRIVRRAGFQA